MTRIVLGLAVCAAMVSAQDWAKERVEKSPRHRESVTITHDGRKVDAFIAYPEASKNTPVIVVIHEIFGMSDWVQEVTDEFAAAGYIAIAPDLLSGMGPKGGGTKDFSGQTEIGQAIGKLPPDQITADLNAVADYGLKLPSAAKKLFVTGFCYGGGQAFRFATNRADLAATMSFYGPPPDKEAMARIKGPVFGFYGGTDNRIGAMIPGAVENMKALGKVYEPVTYEGAGHGFMRAGEQPDASAANAKARDEAWVRIKKIMSSH
ncbi:MAG TPA: dienelactone hydrolase family protein [Bryobacteraceae bacterium]|jgi:carboxymethylenebutenolidase|nr:dienelactone hydrolase family protein [Bryobacteraceae bacterium]